MEKYVRISKNIIPLIWKRIDELGKFPNFKAIALREGKNATEIEIDYCNNAIKELDTLARQLRELVAENHIKINNIFEEIAKITTIAENRIRELTLQKSESEPSANEIRTNKPQRIINSDKLKDYFVPAFYNRQNTNQTDYFTENLMPDLEKQFTGKQFAAIASLIYHSNKMRKRVRPDSFNSWLKTFCGLIGIKYTNYKQSTIKDISDNLSDTFYYLK